MPTKRARAKNSGVVVQYAVPRRGVPPPAYLRRWARAASSSNVTLRIVGAKESRGFNRRYRRKDRPTNVLSFASGDVMLCHPVIAREARAQRKSVAAHYAHLVVHAMLHLRGYAHDGRRAAARMEAREIAILRRGGIRDPYTIE